MSGGIPIDPEYIELTQYPPKPDLNDSNLHEQLRVIDDNFPQVPGVTRVRKTVPASSTHAEIGLYVYTPQVECNRPRPALLNIHGGGYVGGDVSWDHQLCSTIAKEVNAVVISSNYSWAPEHPYPAALNELYEVVKWMHANSGSLGIDVHNIAIGGSSAGGGLAAALALKARDLGQYKFIFQLLIFPMIDDRTNQREHRPEIGKYIWTKGDNRFAWQAYLRNISDGNIPYYAAPSRAPSLAGLPPAFITVGELDLFREEDVEYAQHLWKDGVSCRLDIVPGVYHSFMNRSGTQATKNFYERVIQVLKRAFYPPS